MELLSAITETLSAPRSSARGWLHRDVREALTVVQILAQQQSPYLGTVLSYRAGIANTRFDKLIARLIARGVVSSQRGPGGGYLLGRKMTEISLADVVDAASESPLGEDLGLGSLGLELRAWLRSRTVEELALRA